MALTYTPKGELGTKMPNFTLPTINKTSWSSSSIESSPAKVIMFICAHCPYVQAIEDRLITLGTYLKTKGVPLIAICSNDANEYPEDAPEELKKRADKKGYSFTYLWDETQAVAKEFGAVCTPDFFIFDKENRLAYRGRLDDSWKDPLKVTKEELKLAVEDILKLGKAPIEQYPSMGCSIKWKK
jgi:peroxiredoxin